MNDILNNTEHFSVDFVANTTKNTACQFHHNFELCFFASGRRTYIINEKIYNVIPNTLVIIPPYMKHSTCGTETATRTVVYFTEKFLLEYFSETFTKELLRDFSSPFCALMQPKDNTSPIIKTLHTSFLHNNPTQAALHLAMILTTAKSAPQLPVIEKESSSQSTVTRAIAYIENHFCTLSSLNELAKALRVSLSYLETIFKNNTGISLMQYIIKSKLNHAEKLLLETKKSIAEISAICGFHSKTHFSNTFKKHVGVSPLAYRKLP